MLFGGALVILLGYDMKHGPNGEKHHHEDHAGRNPGEDQMKEWVTAFETLPPDLKKAGVEVINCSSNSALDCFPKAKLTETL